MFKNSLILLIFLSTLAGCSHHSACGMVEPNLGQNTGEPPTKIVKAMYTDTYEFAQDETSKKFVLSNNPPDVKPIEKAIRINLSASANHIQVEAINENSVSPKKSGEMVSNSKSSGTVISSSDTFIVYFDLNSSVISRPESLKLNSFIDELKSAGIHRVDITGYTDRTGSSEVNNALAIKRAEAVADVFTKAGFTVTAQGKGKCCYIDPQNQQFNRRVEILEEKGRTRKEVVKSN